MTVANLVTLCLTAASYIVYSRLLTPTQFAIFGTALTCSRVCVMLLDGGIRNVLIADQREIDRARYTAVSIVLLAISVILASIGWGVSTILDNRVSNIGFVLAYVVPFLLSYPLFFSSMVRLERRLSYGRISIVETISVLIELVTPAVLILVAGVGLTAFIAAACASRLFRTLCFWLYESPAWTMFGKRHLVQALASVRTSLWFQYAILSNAVRDNLPILLVAPIYGTHWAGYYVWALQICAVTSQFAVAAASRVALPVISGHATAGPRYDISAQQIAWLSKLLGPVLVAVWLVMPTLNTLLFEGKWTPAIALLPWLLARMMPSIATTVLYPLVFVQFGPRWLAVVSTGWTAIEVLAAWLILRAFGPIGLAYSYALFVWPGVMLMTSRIQGRRDFSITALFRTVMLNRSTVAALAMGLAIVAGERVMPVDMVVRAAVLIVAAGVATGLAYQCDPLVRAKLRELIAMAGTRTGRSKTMKASS